MERKWNDAQRAAIEIRGRSLAVSAGAGSGKTSVLVERIIRLITDPQTQAD
ncbi:MAG: UvrD-helicase domain-containing protein, partial [Clostridia bacterium]|nr:UvrD-helicase domain-containing protein [Clostridia bacterium]